MSKQSFSPVFRDIIWDVHGRKCTYCRRPLLFANLKIDHVVPECVLDNHETYLEVARSLGLQDGFNIRGYENLAASCDSCNTDKGDSILPPGSAAIILAKVRSAIPKLEKSIKRARVERDLDNTLRAIAASVDSRKFSIDDLRKRLEFMERMPNGVWGSSPTAPPRSPELVVSGHLLREMYPIVWTRQAQDRLVERNVDPERVLRDIKRMAFGNSLKAYKSPRGLQFVVRGDDGLRILFRIVDGKVHVLTVYYRDVGGPMNS